jgi:hypothetical protein
VKQYGVYHDYDYTPNPDLRGFSNDSPFPPEIEVESPYLAARYARTNDELTALVASLRQRVAEPAAAVRFAAWTDETRAYLGRVPSGWEPIRDATFEFRLRDKVLPERTVGFEADGTLRPDKPLAFRESLRLKFRPDEGRLASIRIDVTVAPEPPTEKWKFPPQPVMPRVSVIGADGKARELAWAYGEATAKAPLYENGFELHGVTRGWRLPEVKAPEDMTAVWVLAEPVALQPDESLQLILTGGELPAMRVTTSRLGAPQPLAAASSATVAKLTAPNSAASPDGSVVDAWLASTREDSAGMVRYHRAVAKVSDTRGGKAITMVTEPRRRSRCACCRVATGRTRPVLWSCSPRRRVFCPAVSKARRKNGSPDSISHGGSRVRENPITARAVMNRLWAIYFGIGLSAAVDDLGSQGELPSHPELLDWLASEFRDSGWDLRHMIRLIVTSATYRQSSTTAAELREADPANRLLAAQNPRGGSRPSLCATTPSLIAGPSTCATSAARARSPTSPPATTRAAVSRPRLRRERRRCAVAPRRLHALAAHVSASDARQL